MAATRDLIPDFDDFERYYSGGMSSAEQRLLEGRMLAEPLVAEAYEGFLAWRAQHCDAAEVRSDLRGRLHMRVAQVRRKTLHLWSYASAASVLLALFSYWLVFLRDQGAGPQIPVAAVKQEKMVSYDRAKAPALSSAARKPPGPGAATGVTKKTANPAALAPANQSKAAPLPVLQDEITVAHHAEALEQATDIALTDSFKADVPTISVPSEPSGALTKPGSAQAVGKSIAARARMEPSSFHYVAKDKHRDAAQVAGQQAVAAKPAYKKDLGTYTVPPDALTPAPVAGWLAYQAYLDKNTGSADTTAQVVVTFIVSSSGALSGFAANGPEQLHQDAIRIISNGPAWVPARTKGMAVISLARVQMQFRLTP